MLIADCGRRKRSRPSRIEVGSLPANRDVKVRSRGPARAAAQADFLPAFYLFPFLHFELGKMQIQGEQTLAVIQHDEIALEIKRPCQQYRAIVHGLDRSTAGNAKIQAEMRALCFSIEDTSGAEDVGNFSVGGLGEISRPLALRSDPAQIILLDLLAFFNFLLLLGIGFGEFAFDREGSPEALDIFRGRSVTCGLNEIFSCGVFPATFSPVSSRA